MKKTYKMVLKYAKIFDLPEDQQGKPGDLDRGDPKSEYKWKRELAKNPVATVDAYFTSEEDLQDFMSIDGFEDKVVNPQTGEEKPRIKDGDPEEELGINKYIQLKRKINDTVEFVDRKTGDLKEIDKGGAPSVKIFDPDTNAFVEYDYDTLGAPANGTEAKVRFEVYGKNAATRLEAFGITNLVEYVENNEEEEF